MNTAHNGVCLGQALYKVCNHLQIVPKVSTNTLWLMQTNLCFSRLGTSHATTPRTTIPSSRICALLPPQDRHHFWREALTYQVSPPTVSLLPILIILCSRRCLAHIINLATQAVITTCSKSKFHDGSLDNDKLPEDLGATECDKIGLVHAICVKVSPYCHLSATWSADLGIRRHASWLNAKKPSRLFNIIAS